MVPGAMIDSPTSRPRIDSMTWVTGLIATQPCKKVFADKVVESFLRLTGDGLSRLGFTLTEMDLGC